MCENTNNTQNRPLCSYDANGAIDKSKCIDPLNYFDSSGNVLAYNINSNDNSWGLTFDINETEIDIYDRFNQIIIEEPILP